jgi:hypothetical protein
MIDLRKYSKVFIPLLLLLFGSFTFIGNSNQSPETESITRIKRIHRTIFSVPKGEKVYDNHNLIFDQLSQFNKNGLINQTIQYKGDTLFSFTDFYYDTSNLLLSSKEYNSDNTLYLTINYTHDKKGFITRADYIRTNQKLFDNHRNPVEVEFEKYYQNLYTYIIYINDFMGNVLEKQYYTADHRLSFKYTYKYDFRYNKTEIKYYNNKGSVSWRKKIKYNKEGLMTQYILYMNNRPAMLSKFKYLYDNFHSWVKRTESRKLYNNFFAYEVKDNTLITQREIEYY